MPLPEDSADYVRIPLPRVVADELDRLPPQHRHSLPALFNALRSYLSPRQPSREPEKDEADVRQDVFARSTRKDKDPA